MPSQKLRPVQKSAPGLIISFDNLDSKRSILQSARKLRSSMIAANRGIFISPDLTRKQRQFEYNL